MWHERTQNGAPYEDADPHEDASLNDACAEGRSDEREEILSLAYQLTNQLRSEYGLKNCNPVYRALRKIAEAAATPQWQPLETAPEDELILVATTGGYVDTAHWTDDGDGVKWWWSAGTSQRLHHNLVPIRWMPLPKHPEADANG